MRPQTEKDLFGRRIVPRLRGRRPRPMAAFMKATSKCPYHATPPEFCGCIC